jgi:uncharacterized iron-regulated membrane protein
MRYKQIRQFIVPLHRYLGLGIGIIFAIVGLTGSVLVFQHELEQAAITLRYNAIVPQPHRLSPEAVLKHVETHYGNQENIAIAAIDLAPTPTTPDKVKIKPLNQPSLELLVNPYTGEILGEANENRFFKWMHKLHDRLLIGRIGSFDPGKIIIGVSAFLALVINLTGVILWDGWRRLHQGFQVKWQAKPLRLNYDIHKVVGILAALFLSLTALTGFLWSFKLDKPLAHWITASPPHLSIQRPASVGRPGQSTLSITEILHIADTALPAAVTTRIRLPEQSNQVFKVHKKLLQEKSTTGHSQVVIDGYSGKILEIKNELHRSSHEQVLNIFKKVHDGTFAGLPTRILYLLTGITPLMLLATGFFMYGYRRPDILKSRMVAHNTVTHHLNLPPVDRVTGN